MMLYFYSLHTRACKMIHTKCNMILFTYDIFLLILMLITFPIFVITYMLLHIFMTPMEVYSVRLSDQSMVVCRSRFIFQYQINCLNSWQRACQRTYLVYLTYISRIVTCNIVMLHVQVDIIDFAYLYRAVICHHTLLTCMFA